MNRLTDKVCIVTGASSGIGRAIAVRFAAEGACVVLFDQRSDPIEGGETTLELIAQSGGRGYGVTGDVSCSADIDRVVTETVARNGCLDIMVNNAAIYTGSSLLETSEEDWDRVLQVNLKGVFLGCKRAVEQMITQQPKGDARGRIINISSQHGMIACPGDIAYGVSKSGCVYITRQIANDYTRQGIICNAIAPGKILTGRTDSVSEADLAYACGRTPYNRLGKPTDVASAAVFLASEECTYIAGENLMVDGGWMAG